MQEALRTNITADLTVIRGLRSGHDAAGTKSTGTRAHLNSRAQSEPQQAAPPPVSCIAAVQPLRLLWQIVLRDLVSIDTDSDPLGLVLSVGGAGGVSGAAAKPPSAISLRLADEEAASTVVDVLIDHVEL